MQSRRGGGPHPPAVNLRPDQRADVGIGPTLFRRRNDTRRTVGRGLSPPRDWGGRPQGPPYIWRERYHCRTVAAGVHTRPRSICGRIGGPMWASAPTLFRRRIDTRRTVGRACPRPRLSCPRRRRERGRARRRCARPLGLVMAQVVGFHQAGLLGGVLLPIGAQGDLRGTAPAAVASAALALPRRLGSGFAGGSGAWRPSSAF